MKTYKCLLCGKEYAVKSRYIRHLTLSKVCSTSIQVLDKKYPKQGSISKPKTDQKPESEHDDDSSRIPVDGEYTFLTYKCGYCGRLFKHKNNLYRHVKSRCPIKDEIEHQREEIYKKLVKDYNKVKKENVALRKRMNSVQNSGVVGNNNTVTQNHNEHCSNFNNDNRKINIHLYAFGTENTSFITPEVCKRLFDKGFNSVPKLVETVHFDVNHPECHNIYIPNSRDNKVMIYNGNNWVLQPRDEIIGQLVEDKKTFILGKYEEMEPYLDEKLIRKFKNFYEQNEEKETVESIKDKVILILINNREIPKKTKKLLEKQTSPHIEQIDDN